MHGLRFSQGQYDDQSQCHANGVLGLPPVRCLVQWQYWTKVTSSGQGDVAMTSSKRSYSSPMRHRLCFLSEPAGRLTAVAAAGFFAKGMSHSAIAANRLSRLATIAALYFSASRSRKSQTAVGIRSTSGSCAISPEEWRGVALAIILPGLHFLAHVTVGQFSDGLTFQWSHVLKLFEFQFGRRRVQLAAGEFGRGEGLMDPLSACNALAGPILALAAILHACRKSAACRRVNFIRSDSVFHGELRMGPA